MPTLTSNQYVMKKWYTLLTLMALLAHGITAQISGEKQRRFNLPNMQQDQGLRSYFYDFEVDTAPYTELTNAISLNAGQIWDDPEYYLSMPFPFNCMDVQITAIITEGLGGALVAFDGNPQSTILAYLAPFDVDLLDRGALAGNQSLSPISYKVSGAIGSRILVIEWKNAGFYNEYDELGTMNMFVHLQTWFHEGSNIIEYRFGPRDISNPNLIYDGSAGPVLGLYSFDVLEGVLPYIHMLEGPAANPMLTDWQHANLTGTPPNGIVYRFTPMSSSTHPVTGAAGLALWPNPTGEALNLRMEGMIEQATILSLSGQPLWTGSQLPGQTLIPVDHLPAGFYFLQVQSAQGSQTLKWVKK
jgi:hypothetical protein